MIDFIKDVLVGFAVFFISVIAAAFIFWQVQKRKK